MRLDGEVAVVAVRNYMVTHEEASIVDDNLTALVAVAEDVLNMTG